RRSHSRCTCNRGRARSRRRPWEILLNRWSIDATPSLASPVPQTVMGHNVRLDRLLRWTKEKRGAEQRDDGWLADEGWSLELRRAGLAGDTVLPHLAVERRRLQAEQPGRSARSVDTAGAALQGVEDGAPFDVSQRGRR